MSHRYLIVVQHKSHELLILILLFNAKVTSYWYLYCCSKKKSWVIYIYIIVQHKSHELLIFILLFDTQVTSYWYFVVVQHKQGHAIVHLFTNHVLLKEGRPVPTQLTNRQGTWDWAHQIFQKETLTVASAPFFLFSLGLIILSYSFTASTWLVLLLKLKPWISQLTPKRSIWGYSEKCSGRILQWWT